MKSSAPDLVDASILDVALNEIDFRYEWSHADLSGQADVLDSYGNVARLTSDRRLLLTEGSSVRLSGSSLSGNSDAEVWIFSTPRLLDKIEIGENGLFTSQIAVPDDLEVGEHTILFSAKTLDGRVVAVNFPALVAQRTNKIETTTTGEQTTSTNVRPLKTSTSVAPQSSTTTTKPATTTTTTTKPATTTTTTTKPATTTTTTTKPATTTTTTKPATTTTTTKPATTKPATTKPATTKPATTKPATTTTTSTTIVPTTTTIAPTTTTTIAPTTYAVVYSANTATSGSVPSDATAYSNGATVTVLGNTGVLAKTGFTFGGWCTTQPAAGSACTGTPRAAASSFAITDNVTLYAVWTTAYLTISYLYVDTVTGQAPSTPTTVAYGSTFVTPANTFSRSGYVFAGWRDIDGDATYAPGSTYPTSGTVSAEVNLFATWTALTYSITYHDTNTGSGAGGDGGTAPSSQTGSGVASVALNVNTLSLAGYSFVGWATSDSSTTVAYANSASVSISTNTTLNLYPVWRVATFSSEIGTAANIQTNASGIQSDGRIVVIGSFTSWNGITTNRILRLESNGSRDTSFDTALGSGPAAQQDRILIQTDNKIIVSGTSGKWSGSTNSYRIVRLNSNGSLDNSFITNIGTGPNNNVYTLAQQPDGKLLVGGSFTLWNGTATGGIVRLNTDGTLDSTFMSSVGVGAVTSTSITTIGLQSSGKIIVVGEFTTWNTTAMNRIVRLNTDGSQDTTFNIGTGSNRVIYQARVQSDDKIVLAGDFTTFNGVAANKLTRLNSDGTLDTAFNTKIGTGPNSLTSRLAIQSDGKILVSYGFTTWGGIPVSSLVRLNADGSRDTAFSTAIGTAMTQNVYGITVQSDQKLLLMGVITSWNGNVVGKIVRLNPDGTLD